MQYTNVSAAEFAALDGLADWRHLQVWIAAEFRAGSFPAATALATAVAAAAEAAEHHPDIDIRYPDRVRIMLTTHAAKGVTDADVSLARTISALARGSGATAEPLVSQVVEIAIDTVDADRIRPFWAAVLGYVEYEGTLVDPRRIGPSIWFQDMDPPRTERGRIHLDVLVAHDAAQTRIDAALAAGGTLVSDEFAKAWWILADAEGNEACICTWQDRS